MRHTGQGSSVRCCAPLAPWLPASLQREADLRDSLNRANKELRGLQARSQDADKAAEAKQAALSEAQVRTHLHTVGGWHEWVGG